MAHFWIAKIQVCMNLCIRYDSYVTVFIYSIFGFMQVLGMIPEEPHGEPFEDALGRVQRCIGGGMTTDNNDDDSDLEVIADSVTVNLRCPVSLKLIVGIWQNNFAACYVL